MRYEIIRELGNELEKRIGEEISTFDLALAILKDKVSDDTQFTRLAQYIDSEGLWLTARLIQEAKERGIKLDFSKYEGECVGLPHNIPFVIKQGRRSNAGFDKKIEEIKEICFWRGGYGDPSGPVIVNLDGEIATRIELPFGYDRGFYSDNELEHFMRDESAIEDLMPRAEFLSRFKALGVGLWAREYRDDGVLDGTQWELKITYKDGKKRKYRGSNDFPSSFVKACELFGFPVYDDEDDE